MQTSIKLVLGAILLLIGGYFAYSKVFGTSGTAHVATVQLQAEPAQLVLAVVGRVRSQAAVDIRSERAGAITKMLYDEGDSVEAGEILAHIRSEEEEANLSVNLAQLQALDAALNLAQLQFNRTETLASKKLVSQAALDEARANLATAQANKRAARASITQTRARVGEYDVRAPMAGIILSRPLDPGQVVGTVDVIFQIGSQDAVEIEAEVDEYYADKLKVGMSALLSPSGSNTVFDGLINEIAPRIDPLTGGRLVRLLPETDNAAFLPGRSVDVNIEVETFEQALSLPRSALIRDGEAWTVFVVENGKAAPRETSFIDWPGGSVVITSGPQSGDEVILAPLQVSSGMTIKSPKKGTR
jgi:RND family efflux transporter MFP subunit